MGLRSRKQVTGELLDTETVTSSSERDGWKRAESFSTSLAAYSTLRTVRERQGGR